MTMDGKPTKVKASRVRRAASDLERAHAKYQHLRAELKSAERDMRRALSLMKRLTMPIRGASRAAGYGPIRTSTTE